MVAESALDPTIMPLATCYSASIHGIHARKVDVEVHIGTGTPSMVIVGLPDVAIRESRDRVSTALLTCGFAMPKGHMTINLAPADIRKEGPSFDLPMALGVLAASGQLDTKCHEKIMSLGELALDGRIRPVKGVLSMALLARGIGCETMLIPSKNALEASQVEGLEILPVNHLREATEMLSGQRKPTTIERLHQERFQPEAGFITCNAMMSRSALKTFCPLDAEGQALMRKAYDHWGVSGRVYDRLLRLARTIADLEASSDIRAPHLMEALQYRGVIDRYLGG